MNKSVQKYVFFIVLLGINISCLIGMDNGSQRSLGCAWDAKEGSEYVPLEMSQYNASYAEKALDSILVDGIRYGQVGKVSQALREGANPNAILAANTNLHASVATFKYPLVLAIKCYSNRDLEDSVDTLQILELLLQNNADVNSRDVNPLEHGLCMSDPMITKMLLRYGANIYLINERTLDWAKGRIEMKKILEDHVNLLEKVKSSDPAILYDAMRDAIKNDYHLPVIGLIKRGVPVCESDLKLAKDYASKRSGRIIVNQLRLTSPVGGVCKAGVIEKKTGLPAEILDHIARFTH